MQHETHFHTGPQLLEVEDGESSGSVTSPQSTNNKNKKRRRHRKPQPRWKVITTYVCLATLAVVLTAACQDTKLWLSANNDTAAQTDQTQQKKFDISAYSLDNVDGPQILRLLSSFAIVLLSLALVQGSDPGYVTAENVQAAFDMVEEDEAGLLVDDDNNLEEEEENGKNATQPMQLFGAEGPQQPLNLSQWRIRLPIFLNAGTPSHQVDGKVASRRKFGPFRTDQNVNTASPHTDPTRVLSERSTVTPARNVSPPSIITAIS